MSRFRRALVAFVGLAVVGIGVVVALAGSAAGATPLLASILIGAAVLVGLALAVRNVRGTLDASADALPVPWTDDDAYATPAPERSRRDDRLSSERFATVVRRAGEAAREEGTVADGIAVLRPPLRRALGEALVQGGRTEDAAKRALADGTWTDDPVAASVLEESIAPPRRSIRERIVAWLFPERVVRERARRATAAVAEAADEALPPVPGRAAPRTVPVVQPRLEELRRGADGRLQRAAEPGTVRRGPRPPRPDRTGSTPIDGEGPTDSGDPERETDAEVTRG